MIFDDNTAYQIYRIFVAIFGTLGMVVATSPMRKNYKRNLLFFRRICHLCNCVHLFFHAFLGISVFSQKRYPYYFSAGCDHDLYDCRHHRLKACLQMPVSAPALTLPSDQCNTAQHTV